MLTVMQFVLTETAIDRCFKDFCYLKLKISSLEKHHFQLPLKTIIPDSLNLVLVTYCGLHDLQIKLSASDLFFLEDAYRQESTEIGLNTTQINNNVKEVNEQHRRG